MSRYLLSSATIEPTRSPRVLSRRRDDQAPDACHDDHAEGDQRVPDERLGLARLDQLIEREADRGEPPSTGSKM